MCEPSMVAKVIEIDNELETFQRIVGGCIEEYMPFVDDVAIVCNGERKMNGVEHLKIISEAEDIAPINSEEKRDDHNYIWYKINNEEELELLRKAYDYRIGQVEQYPEIICIEADYYYEDIWDYYLSDMFKYTKWFWEKFGYTVSFEKGENSYDTN